MKKLLYFITILNVSFLLISSFWLFSYDNQFRLLKEKAEIQIEKPRDISNSKFVEIIRNISEELDSDIAYTTFDMNNDKYVENIYVTRNHLDFLNIPIENSNYKIDEYSTDLSLGKSIIYGSNFIGDYSINKFEDICYLSLGKNNYYISDKDALAWEKQLQEKNIPEQILQRKIRANFSSVSQTQKVNLVKGLLAICMFLTLLFYFHMQKKEIAIRKFNGENLKDIIIKELLDIRIVLFIIFCSIVFSLVLIFLKWNSMTAILFLYFIRFELLIFLIGILLFSFIVISYITGLVGVEEIKGKNEKNKLYIVFAFSKLFILIILVLNTTGFAAEFTSLNNLNRSNLEINHKIENYVYVTIYSSIRDLYDKYEDAFKGREIAEQRLKHFISDTENKFDGIINYTGNYRLKGDLDDDEVRTITINLNYLEINPIKDISGNIITKDMISEDSPTLILSEKEDVKKAVKAYVNTFNQWEAAYGNTLQITSRDVNVLYYSEDSKIYGLNPFTNAKYVGILKRPIIMIYNEKYRIFDAREIVSNGAYFLKCKTEYPYMEILPYLEKNRLDKYIIESPKIQNAFSDEISETNQVVMIDLCLIILYLCPVIFFTIYYSKLYICNYKLEVFIKYINGYKFCSIYKKIFLIEILQTILIALIMIYCKLTLYVLLFVSVVDFMVLLFSLCRFEKQNNSSILKGAI